MNLFYFIIYNLLYFTSIFLKVHIVQVSLVLDIFVMVGILDGYHGLVNCGLRKWCYSMVTKCSVVPQTLGMSIVEEIVWMKKYKKHGPHAWYKFFSTIAVTFIKERLTRVITDVNNFTESSIFYVYF